MPQPILACATLRSALPLLLLVRAVSSQGPVMPHSPPPPTMPCLFYPDPSDSKLYYDLSPLLQRQTPLPDMKIPGSAGDGSWFYVRICQPPARGPCTGSECDDCKVTSPAGINTWSSGQGDTCGAIGTLSTVTWALQDESNPKGGAQMSFTSGDPAGGKDRTSTLVLVCDPKANDPYGVSAVETPTGSLHYVVTVAAADACVVGPKPLSWGWLTIILFGVTVFVYFVGGSAYNVKVREQEGLAIIPQWTYWRQLPGLVRDGVVFSWKHGRVIAYNAPRRMREWWQGRGSQELREPIAAASED